MLSKNLKGLSFYLFLTFLLSNFFPFNSSLESCSFLFLNEKCKCEQNSTIYNVNCSEKRFETVDSISNQDLSNLNLTKLKIIVGITNKYILKVLNFTFSHLKIEEIDLSSNYIEEFSANSFHNLTGLTSLILNENRLKSLHNLNYNFDNFEPSLLNLRIEYNQIERLDEPFSSNLKNLKYLSLASNSIHFIGANVFKFLKSLTFLNLNFNDIKQIESADCFSYLTSLTDFRINFLEFDQEKVLASIKSLKKLQYLQFEYSNLDQIPQSANNLYYLYLDKNRIKTLSNLSSSLIFLKIYRNQIESINIHSLKNLTRLGAIDLGQNKISQIEKRAFADCKSLTELYMHRNYITKLDPEMFTGLLKLNYLMLEENLIETLDESIFKQIPTLNRIVLKSNLIKQLSNQMFNSLPNIQKLDFSVSSLSEIEENSFSNQDKLIQINLNENSLREIKSHTFVNLSSLESLYLNDNHLEKIENNSFVNVKNLITLDLSKNRFIQIDFFLSEFSSLKTLSLSQNQIEKIDPFTFVGNENLKELDLSDNKLFKLENFTFKGLEKSLRVLRVNKNDFQAIKSHYFENLFTLEELYLENNQISIVEWNSFLTLVSLNRIDLGSNMIYKLDPNTFSSLNYLSYLNLNLNELSKMSLKRKNVTQILFFKINKLDDNSFESVKGLERLYANSSGIKFLNRFCFVSLGKTLKHLYLFQNEIQTLNESLQNLTILNYLDLSFNKIEAIGKNEFKNINYLFSLKLRSNPIKVLEVTPSLKYLYVLSLHSTTSEIIKSITFSYFSRLETLELSSNTIDSLDFISSMKQLKQILMENVAIKQTANYSLLFDRLYYLEQIWMENVENLKLTNSKLFSNKLINLKYLKMSGMKLKSFEETQIDFDFTRNLKQIDLSSNQLTKVYRKHFVNMNNLAYVFLQNNRINYIENNSFSATGLSLSRLDLSSNEIKELSFQTLNTQSLYLFNNRLDALNNVSIYSGLSSTLRLRNNSIETFPDSVLSNKLNINFLDLSLNKISVLESLKKGESDFLIKLSILNMSQNGLHSLETNCILSKMKMLLSLDLSQNLLEYLNKTVFDQLKKLVILNLNQNKLKVIETHFIRYAQNMASLDLSDNNLSVVEEAALENFKSLKKLSLQLNFDLVLKNQKKVLPLLTHVLISSPFLRKNSSNILNLMKMLAPKFLISNGKNSFYYSVHVDYDPEVSVYTIKECDDIILMIKKNLHLNLKNDLDMKKFLDTCRYLSENLNKSL